MPEVISSLWFEEISFIHEKLFDTPLGKLTVRQVVILIAFGISAWLAFKSVTDDLLKIAISSLLMILGLMFTFQRIKTLTPEQSVMLALLALVNPKGGRNNNKTKIRIPALTFIGGQESSDNLLMPCLTKAPTSTKVSRFRLRWPFLKIQKVKSTSPMNDSRSWWTEKVQAGYFQTRRY